MNGSDAVFAAVAAAAWLDQGCPPELAHRPPLPLTPMTKPVGAYRPIVRAGDWLIVSGQVGIREGELVAGGFHGQLTQALDNLEGLLASEGATAHRRGQDHRAPPPHGRLRPAERDLDTPLRRPPPARSAFGVGELPLHALVEVEAWAYTGS